MKLIFIALLFFAHSVCAQRQIVTFGPNAGEMPTVIFDGDKSEGYLKIYVGKNASAGDVLAVNVNSGAEIDSFSLKVLQCQDPRVFVRCEIDRKSRVLMVKSSQPLREGEAIRFYWKVYSKRARA